jgi:hypothetical protein
MRAGTSGRRGGAGQTAEVAARDAVTAEFRLIRLESMYTSDSVLIARFGRCVCGSSASVKLL